MSKAGRHRRNMVWMTSSDLAIKLLGVFYFYYLSRALSGSELATYALFLSLFPIASVVMGLGLPDVVTRELAREDLVRRPKLVRRVFTLQCGCAGMLALGTAILTLRADGNTAAALWAAWAVGFLWAGISLQSAIFAAHEDFRPVSAVNAIIRIAMTLGSLALLYAGFRLRALLGYMVPLTALQLAALFFLQRRLHHGTLAVSEPVSHRVLLREGSAMMFGRLMATGYYRTGMPVLQALQMPNVSQLYGQGFRFWVLFTTLPDTLESLFLPVMSRRAKLDTETQRFALLRFFKYMLMAGIPSGVGATVLAPQLTATLIGAGWEGSTPAIIALTWVMMFTMADRPAVVYLRARGSQRMLVWIYGVALIGKVALAWYLAPRYGLAGMLTIDLTLSALLSGAIWCGVKRVLPSLRLTDMLGVTWKAAVAALVMGAVLWPIRLLPIYISVPAGVAVYGLVIMALRGIDEFDWQMLRGRTPAPTA